MTSTIWTPDAIRDSIAEALEHANPNRPDYCTNVELEHLERWQEGIAALQAQRDELLEMAIELRAWANLQDPDELGHPLLCSAINKARAALASAAKGGAA